MCIIIYKPEKAHVDKATLKNCFSNNDDGAGFMYVEDGQLHVMKGYMDFKPFYKAWRDNVNDKQKAVLHFRIRTHGALDKFNTHPHIVSDGVAIAHNGILSNHCTSNQLSDTAVFVKRVLAGLPFDFYYNESVNELVEDSIGLGNKMVLMSKTGKVVIYNEYGGDWSDNCWYSNKSYKYRSTLNICKKSIAAATTKYFGLPDEWGNYTQYGNFGTREMADGEIEDNTEDWGEVMTADEDEVEHFTAEYGKGAHADVFSCGHCGANVGNVSLNIETCLECDHTLSKQVMTFCFWCKNCKAPSVEAFSHCPNCGDDRNPYDVMPEEIMYIEPFGRDKSEALAVVGVTDIEVSDISKWCAICQERQTMCSSNSKKTESMEWDDYVNYCVSCYIKKRNESHVSDGEKGVICDGRKG